jgi:hypothetical protein
MVQPQAEDLHWVQIEDFVEVFNRVYLAHDHTFEKDGVLKRFVSKWVPGDFIGGSGGPPVIIATQTSEAAPAPAAEGAGAALLETEEEGEEGGNRGKPQPSAVPAVVVERYAMINDTFTDNPMYPFSVTEPTTFSACLYQKDRRWNMGRLGDNARDVLTKQFASRGERLQACMEYPTGISFLVVRLSGLKHRLTEFKLKKIISGSENLVFSHVTNNILTLRPGRYAIVPYTHTTLSRSMEYVLASNHLAGHVEWEIEDVLEQRLVDDAPSDEDDDEEMQPDDNDLLHLHEGTDDVSVMSYEKVMLFPVLRFTARFSCCRIYECDVDQVKVHGDEDGFGSEQEEEESDAGSQEGSRVKVPREKVNPPRILLYKPWEYAESTEELGVAQVFSEVGDVMKYVKALRGEVRKLHATIRALQPSQLAGPAGAGAGNGAGPAGTVSGAPGQPPGSPQRAADSNKLINPTKRR